MTTNIAVTAYLSGLDKHLATLTPRQARNAVNSEITRCAKLARALTAWARNLGEGLCPTRFSATDLVLLDGELRMRKEKMRRSHDDRDASC